MKIKHLPALHANVECLKKKGFQNRLVDNSFLIVPAPLNQQNHRLAVTHLVKFRRTRSIS